MQQIVAVWTYSVQQMEPQVPPHKPQAGLKVDNMLKSSRLFETLWNQIPKSLRLKVPHRTEINTVRFQHKKN